MSRRLHALALAAVLAAPAVALGQSTAPQAREFMLRGPGVGMTCAAWLELRAAADGMFAVQKREQYRSVVAWGLGYLSGAARYDEELDPLRRMDEEATVAWLAAHCRTQPAQEFRLALEAFIEAHPRR